MNALLSAVLLVVQDPALPPAPRAAEAPASTAAALDVVELKNGDRLQGRITAEVDGYVELRLDDGATVGLSTTQVAAVRRAALPLATTAAPLAPRGEWFVLHDATGAAVGWLSSSIRVGADGSFTVGEEYEFQQGKRRYQVTSLASADALRRPTSCYFRERISEPTLASLQVQSLDPASQADRIVDERIVEASCRGEVLAVMHLDRTGRRERALPWSPLASFPLLARTLARQAGAAVGPTTLFDPAGEELIVRSYSAGRQRSVLIEGRAEQVTELTETSPTGRNSEWLDGDLRTVRRELAGPALVAVPSNADSARFAVGATTIPGALLAEAGGRFGLWLPNPAWTAIESPAGQVGATCEAHGASVVLAQLDHLEPDTSLDAAADAVANWFRLLHPDLRLEARTAGALRDRATVQLVAAGRRGGVPWRATVDVVPHHAHFLVLTCVYPAAAGEELAADLAFVARSVEWEPQSLAPTLQGPLAERRPAAHRPRDTVPSQQPSRVAVAGSAASR
jgi:hypothetical protein